MFGKSVRRLAAVWLLGLLSLASPAHAEVIATFYSHEFGDQFPHAFVVLKGEDNGAAVNVNYGFTPVTTSPAILFGKVKGKVSSGLTPGYIRKSNAHFSVRLTSAQYRAILAEAEAWRVAKQPSYSLGAANCVHFVGVLARASGLKTNPTSKFFKKPRSYLTEVKGLNPGVLAPVG